MIGIREIIRDVLNVEYPYIYVWGNNPKRAMMKGRRCRVLRRGSLNSCMVEFEDGQAEIISRNALQKVETVRCRTLRVSNT